MQKRPPLLAGIKILDLATVVAAPFAATLCADLGAKVTKIELPSGNDMLRSLAPSTKEHSFYWKAINRGKQGITLDIRKPEGKALFLKIIAQQDVLVENFRTGTLDNWGLSLKELHQINPRLIVLRLTGFGQTGPYANRPGYARIFEAMSGLTNLIGTPESGPQHPNLPMGDLIAGLFGAFSIASAIASIRGNPKASGFEIDLSATESLFRLLDPLPVEYEFLNHERTHVGNRAGYTAPSSMYRTKDHIWVTLVAASDVGFTNFSQAIGKPEWVHDPKFCNNLKRCENTEELDVAIKKWFIEHDFHEVQTTLDQADVPYTKVYGIEDIVNDPQVKAREGIIRLKDSVLGSIPAPCVVPRIADTEKTEISTGPLKGEHNQSFYEDLGVTATEMKHLISIGVI